MPNPINAADLKKIPPWAYGVAIIGGAGLFIALRSQGTKAPASGLADAQYGEELLSLQGRISQLENPPPKPTPTPTPGPIPIPVPTPGPNPVPPPPKPPPLPTPPPAVHHDRCGNPVSAQGVPLDPAHWIHCDQNGHPVEPPPLPHPSPNPHPGPAPAPVEHGTPHHIVTPAPNTSEGGTKRPLWPGETIQSVGRQHGLAPQTALAANSAGATPHYPAGEVFIPHGR